jgi:(2R)-sulfolactate sulfo-lyase subunit alpha
MNIGPFILLHDDDNVLVCREHAMAGERLDLDGAPLVLPQDIDVGHKIARYDLEPGTKIIKYGASIGSMTALTLRGAHVHMHNMQSDYIKTHTREASADE